MARSPIFGLAVASVLVSLSACKSTMDGIVEGGKSLGRGAMNAVDAGAEALGLSSTTKTELANFHAYSIHQKEKLWCWAASAAMVLNYNHPDVELTQEDIVERIKGYGEDGELVVEMAKRYEIYRALSPNTDVAGFAEIWPALERQLTEEIENSIEIAKQSTLNGELATVPSSISVNIDETVPIDDTLDALFPTRAVPLKALIAGQPVVAGVKDDAAGGNHAMVIVGAIYKDSKSLDERLAAADDATGGAAGTTEFAKSIKSALPSEERLAQARALGDRMGLPLDAVETIILINPWLEQNKDTQENELRIEMSCEDFLANVSFVATEATAHEVLTRWNRLATITVE